MYSNRKAARYGGVGVRSYRSFFCLLILSHFLAFDALAFDKRIVDLCRRQLAPVDIIEDPNAPIDPISGQFVLRSLSVERVHKLIEALRHNYQHVDQNFFSMLGAYEGLVLAAATGNNLDFSGSPGTNKTGLINWAFPNAFSRTIEETTHPRNLLGGQTAKGSAEGREDINVEDGMLPHEYVILDEWANGNSLLYGALQSVMNPGERYLDVNNTRYKAGIRSVFLTGNANRYQVYEKFRDNLVDSGPFLSRILFASVPRRKLQAHEYEALTRQKSRETLLENTARFAEDPSVRASAQAQLNKMRSWPIDMDLIATIAEHIFTVSDELNKAITAFTYEFDSKVLEKVRLSQKEFRANPKAEIIPFVPPALLNNRTHSQLAKIIRVSAAIDFLFHPEAEKILSQHFPKKRILDSHSLWRLFSLVTYQYTGVTRYHVETRQVEFNLLREYDGSLNGRLVTEDGEKSYAATEIDSKLVEHVFLLQRLFNGSLKAVLDPYFTKLAQARSLVPISGRPEKPKVSFEEEVAMYLRK